MPFTDSTLPTDVSGYPSGSVYVPSTGPVAWQGAKAGNDGSKDYAVGLVNATLQAGTALAGAMAMNDGLKATYRASIAALVAVTGCTDLFTLTGSSTKTIRITRVEFSGTVATAALYLDVICLLRSTANSSGTSTSPTVVPLDSNSAAGSAVARAYTANPTTGTLVGAITTDKILLPLAGTPTLTQRLVIEFGNRPAQAVVLRGTTQVFAINLNAVTLANATSIDIAIEWTEE